MKANAVIIALVLSVMCVPLGYCDSSRIEQLPMTRAEWRSLLKWDDACEAGVAHLVNSGFGFVGVIHYEMLDSTSLVSVVCQTGSYNQGKIIFHLRNTESGRLSTLLVFPQFRYKQPSSESSGYFDPKEKVQDNSVDLFYVYNDGLLWGNLSVDKQKQIITNNDFFRGGDTGCGTHTMYKLFKAKPQVVVFRAQPHCREGAVPIEKWKLYPKEIRSTWPTGPVPDN